MQRLFLVIVSFFSEVFMSFPHQEIAPMGSLTGDQPVKGGEYPRLFSFLKSSLVCALILWHHECWESVPLQPWESLGTIALLTIILLQLWTADSLGLWYTGGIGTRQGQDLVESGPYQYVVHPAAALGLLHNLLILSLVTSLPGWQITVLFFVDFLMTERRLWVEDQVLFKKWGGRWAEFTKSRYRLFPCLY
jgi:isoprenylcysteine carboxyl methyltransferase (ICMT) family protein YpbQ